MFCNKCGAEIGEEQAFCSKCGAESPKIKKFCKKCGAQLPVNANVCPKCGVSLKEEPKAEKSGGKKASEDKLCGKNKTTAIILAILLGHWGAHNFYLGETYKALVKIGLSLFTAGTIPLVLIIIDIIRLATNEYVVDPKAFF